MVNQYRGFMVEHTTTIMDGETVHQCDASDGTRTATAYSMVSPENAERSTMVMIDVIRHVENEAWFHH